MRYPEYLISGSDRITNYSDRTDWITNISKNPNTKSVPTRNPHPPNLQFEFNIYVG